MARGDKVVAAGAKKPRVRVGVALLEPCQRRTDGEGLSGAARHVNPLEADEPGATPLATSVELHHIGAVARPAIDNATAQHQVVPVAVEADVRQLEGRIREPKAE